MSDRENVSIRMERDLHDAVKIAACRERRTMADLVSEACIEYLKQKSKLA